MLFWILAFSEWPWYQHRSRPSLPDGQILLHEDFRLGRGGEVDIAGAPRDLPLVHFVENGLDERNVGPRGVIGQFAEGLPLVVIHGPAGDEVGHNWEGALVQHFSIF